MIFIFFQLFLGIIALVMSYYLYDNTKPFFQQSFPFTLLSGFGVGTLVFAPIAGLMLYFCSP